MCSLVMSCCLTSRWLRHQDFDCNNFTPTHSHSSSPRLLWWWWRITIYCHNLVRDLLVLKVMTICKIELFSRVKQYRRVKQDVFYFVSISPPISENTLSNGFWVPVFYKKPNLCSEKKKRKKNRKPDLFFQGRLSRPSKDRNQNSFWTSDGNRCHNEVCPVRTYMWLLPANNKSWICKLALNSLTKFLLLLIKEMVTRESVRRMNWWRHINNLLSQTSHSVQRCGEKSKRVVVLLHDERWLKNPCPCTDIVTSHRTTLFLSYYILQIY